MTTNCNHCGRETRLASEVNLSGQYATRAGVAFQSVRVVLCVDCATDLLDWLTTPAPATRFATEPDEATKRELALAWRHAMRAQESKNRALNELDRLRAILKEDSQ